MTACMHLLPRLGRYIMSATLCVAKNRASSDVNIIYSPSLRQSVSLYLPLGPGTASRKESNKVSPCPHRATSFTRSSRAVDVSESDGRACLLCTPCSRFDRRP